MVICGSARVPAVLPIPARAPTALLQRRTGPFCVRMDLPCGINRNGLPLKGRCAHQRPVCGLGAIGGGSKGEQRATRCAALPVFHIADDIAVIYKATGVPLVDELMKMGSVEAAVQRSTHLLAFLAAAALVGTLVMRAMDAAAGRRMAAAGQARFRVGSALVAAAYRPCKVMLPVYCAARAATVVLALAQVAATKLQLDPAATLCCWLDHGLRSAVQWCTLAAGASNTPLHMLPALEWLTQLVQDCSELVLIAAVAWTALRLKSSAIAWQARRLQLDSDPYNDGAVPLLRLLSDGLSVVIVVVAAGVTLSGFGFHIGPLMASIGGVGVVVGLATQQLLANLASAVSLFMTRPFVTGDEIQLINPEGVEVEGEVLNIEPTRTILRDSNSGCIVHINNADVANSLVKNFTQSRTLSRLQQMDAAGTLGRRGVPAQRTVQELWAMRTEEFGLGSSAGSDAEAASAGGALGAA